MINATQAQILVVTYLILSFAIGFLIDQVHSLKQKVHTLERENKRLTDIVNRPQKPLPERLRSIHERMGGLTLDDEINLLRLNPEGNPTSLRDGED